MKSIIIITLIIFINIIFINSAYAQTTNPSGKTPEEWAVQNQINNTPITVSPSSSSDNSFLAGLLKKLGSLVDGVRLFLHQPTDPPTVFQQSQVVQQSQLPPELKPSPNADVTNQLQQNLGGSAGAYGVMLPNFGDSGVGQSEQGYEQAHFPDGIHPITSAPQNQ